MVLPEAPEEEDMMQNVRINGRKTLKLSKDALEVGTKKCFSGFYKFDKSYPWKDIEKVGVNWHCFSGVLTVKLRNGESYQFKMSKHKLVATASAMHRRIGKTKSDAPRNPVDEKIRKLLQNHAKVGVSDAGLLVKRGTGCSAGTVLSPWNSFVSLRLSRGCHYGQITVHTVMKASPVKKKSTSTLPGVGFKSGGENLLSDSDEDDVDFYDDRALDKFEIKTDAGISEQLYSALKARLSEKFASMEELPGGDPIKSKKVMAKLTGSGIDATLFGTCGKEAKIFTPWSNVISVAFKHPTCCRQSCIVIQDRSTNPILLKGVPFNAFHNLEKAFSEKSREDVALKASGKSAAACDSCVTKGLTVDTDGVYYELSRCCRRKVNTFMPWSKLDGLRMDASAAGRTTIDLITESGDTFRVAKTTNKKAREEFEKLHQAKYGAKVAENAKEFNKKGQFSCNLSDQSLYLSLNNGKRVLEVDLDRVIGARRCKKTHSQLEVGISMGKLSHIETIPLVEGNNARELSKDIRVQAEKRKKKLLMEAGRV